MIKARTLWFAFAWILSACVSTAARADKPAIIFDPSAAGRAELLEVVGLALQGHHVTLVDDALTHESSLSIERTPRRDANGELLNGRVLEMPEHFTLHRRGSRCVLVQESTRREWVLHKVKCMSL